MESKTRPDSSSEILVLLSVQMREISNFMVMVFDGGAKSQKQKSKGRTTSVLRDPAQVGLRPGWAGLADGLSPLWPIYSNECAGPPVTLLLLLAPS